MLSRKYFIVIQIGLEKFLLDEMENKLNHSFLHLKKRLKVYKFSVVTGGIEFEYELSEGQYQNLILKYLLDLKSCTKIYQRLISKKVSDFPKLYTVIKSLPWNKFLKSSQYDIQVTAHRSRLNMKKKIITTCQEAINSKISSLENNEKEKATILLRFEDDLLTVSLNLEGSIYQRKTHGLKGAAPLRENIAYTFAQFAFAPKFTNLLSTKKKLTIWDPFCGSGTIPSECLIYFKENAIDDFSIVASDINRDLITHLKEKKEIAFYFHDFFSNKKTFPPGFKPNVIIANPPFGKRLILKNQDSFINEFIQLCFNRYQAQHVFLLFPFQDLVLKKKNLKFYPDQMAPFIMGSLKVAFAYYQNPMR